MKNIMEIPTAALDENTDELVIIDQTRLPNETVLVRIHTLKETFDAIKTLAVRGAPAIGVAAAVGLYAASERFIVGGREDFVRQLLEGREYLASSRPTAVNLFWALDRMKKVILSNPDKDVPALKALLRGEALAIWKEDVDVCRRLGEYGLTLIQDGDAILTHCNAGQLATVKYGTALSPIHVGAERGMRFKVYCDETRPLLQGARLSAFEMVSAGMETTVLCDNMAASLMKKGVIQAVFTGCDRVASNGDAANKIGTMNVAILAKHFHIPFYIFAPTSTIDMKCKSGDDIVIEYRSPEEVSELWFEKRMAPEGVNIYNPAFDVTEASLITAFVTEYGVIRPPYTEAFKDLFQRMGSEK